MQFCEDLFSSTSFFFIVVLRYKVGETFLHLPHTQAVKRLEKDQAVIDSKVSSLASSAEECEKNLKELKVALYAKFGSTINLDE
jgi:prefoldin subunit 4